MKALSRIKELANGAPLPNWVKLIALGFALAAVWYGQQDAVGRLIRAQDAKIEAQDRTVAALAGQIQRTRILDSLQVVELRKDLTSLRATEDARTDQLNYELGRISEKLGYVMRKIQ